MELPGVQISTVGAQYALENAQALVEDADLLAAHGRYARAVSLLVLAGEETVKAMVMQWAAVAPVTQGIHWQQAFFSHKAKHSVLSFSALFDAILSDLTPLLQGAISSLESLVGPDGAVCEEKLKRYFEAQLDNPAFLAQFEKRMESAQTSALWWFVEADELKQRGFYVQYREPEEWISPESITREDYLTIREKTANHLERAQLWVGRPEEFDPLAFTEPESLVRFIANWGGLMALTKKWGKNGPTT